MKRFIIFCLVILLFACKKDDEATVVVNASSGNSSEGTVQFTPSDYTVGSSITFSATPNTGYIFVNWTDSNSNTKLIATGNVRGESIEKGEFSADNVEYDLGDKSLNFSMFGSKQVNVKLKN